MKRIAAALALAASLTACSVELPTASAPQAGASVLLEEHGNASVCQNCVFGPVVYTRSAGTPVTEVSTFSGDPTTEYFIDIDDGGTQGAHGSVKLNDESVYNGGHLHLAVHLAASNTLSARLTGKPGSTLTISIQATSVPVSSLRLVYAEDLNNNLSIYTMMGDGSGRRFINIGTGPTQRGNVILARGAFQDNTIYAMDGSGGNRQRILGAGPSYAPDLSPDGQRFVLLYGDCGGGHPIATANLDGSGLTVLPICATQVPRWSPLGDRIAYSFGATLYTAKVDGSDIRAVSTLTADLGGPSWSPDGTRLAFSWKPTATANFGIYIINIDGSNLRQVTNPSADDYVGDWSPTGDWLTFFSTRSGILALWVIRTDGSGAMLVPTSSARPDAVRWVR